MCWPNRLCISMASFDSSELQVGRCASDLKARQRVVSARKILCQDRVTGTRAEHHHPERDLSTLTRFHMPLKAFTTHSCLGPRNFHMRRSSYLSALERGGRWRQCLRQLEATRSKRAAGFQGDVKLSSIYLILSYISYY